MTEPTNPAAGALDVAGLHALASAADLACEWVWRAPWTARPTDARYPQLDQQVVDRRGEVVLSMLAGPEVAAYLAAVSPDVMLRLLAVLSERDAEIARLREALRKLGRHERDCYANGYNTRRGLPQPEGLTCNCGLDAALAAARGEGTAHLRERCIAAERALVGLYGQCEAHGFDVGDGNWPAVMETALQAVDAAHRAAAERGESLFPRPNSAAAGGEVDRDR